MTQVKERPILFSAAMVRAILAGEKTQTRRAIKGVENDNCLHKGKHHFHVLDIEKSVLHCPYGKPGDAIWVREAWRSRGDGGRDNYISPRHLRPHGVWYEADGIATESERVGKLRSSLHMPLWASRILLEVVSVRVERLTDICDQDAEAEGISFLRNIPDADETLSATKLFEALWESINGAGSWEQNPWVWVIEFKRVEG